MESIEGRTVSVLVRDRIWVRGQAHEYQDRLIVTFDQFKGPGSIVRIENRRVEGERSRLKQFLATHGIAWA